LKLKHIGQLAVIVTQQYRSIHRPFVSVTVPPQEVTNGVLQLLVVEFRRGRLSTEGNLWTPEGFLRRNIRIKKGGLIKSDVLSQDLDWLNRNPFRGVNAIFQPGKRTGDSDLRLRVKERKPWQVYAGYSNTGTQATDRNRFYLGANITNIPIIDHQLGYKFTTSSDFWNAPDDALGSNSNLSYVSHAATYKIPLPWRHNLHLQGSYVTTKSDLVTPFTQETSSSQLALGYAVPLWLPKGVRAEFSAGFEYKRQVVELYFDGTQANKTQLDILQFNAGAMASWSDSLGQSSVDLRLVVSPGGLTSDNSSPAFVAATGDPSADPRYTYFYGHLKRRTKLPAQFFWMTDLVIQVANRSLPGIEHLALGGKATARGYEELEASGDNGVILSNELHFGGGKLLGEIKGFGFTDRISPYAFLDFGFVEDRFNTESQSFLSTGVGASYGLTQHFFVSADLGVALRDGASTQKGDKRFQIQMTASY